MRGQIGRLLLSDVALHLYGGAGLALPIAPFAPWWACALTIGGGGLLREQAQHAQKATGDLRVRIATTLMYSGPTAPSAWEQWTGWMDSPKKWAEGLAWGLGAAIMGALV